MFRKGALLLILCTVAGGVAGFLGAAPASAQSSDVTVDPNSPAGAQYDIPVRRARRDAQGKDAKGNPDNPSLFGEGVTPDSSGDDSSSGSDEGDEPSKSDKRADKKDSKDDSKAVAPAATGGGGDGGSGNPPTLLVTQAKEETGGGSGLLLAVVGISLALVAAATLSGWMIRRRSP